MKNTNKNCLPNDFEVKCYKRTPNYGMFFLWLALIGFISLLAFDRVRSEPTQTGTPSQHTQINGSDRPEPLSELHGGCEKIGYDARGVQIYDCTDYKKLGAVPVAVIRTRYSRADSCHNKKTVNGNEICLTAIGRDTNEGTTVACPRSIKLGTTAILDGQIFICEDRYSTYLDKKRPLPTIDVFMEANNIHTVPAYKQTIAHFLSYANK